MKYKIGDKVKILRCFFNGLYHNMTGKIIEELGKLSLVKIDYDDKMLVVFNEQLIKIEKGLEIE